MGSNPHHCVRIKYVCMLMMTSIAQLVPKLANAACEAHSHVIGRRCFHSRLGNTRSLQARYRALSPIHVSCEDRVASARPRRLLSKRCLALFLMPGTIRCTAQEMLSEVRALLKIMLRPHAGCPSSLLYSKQHLTARVINQKLTKLFCTCVGNGR